MWPYPLGLYHDVYGIGDWHWLTIPVHEEEGTS